MCIRDSINTVLREVVLSNDQGQWRGSNKWGELSEYVAELDRLIGTMVDRAQGRWGDLRRHLEFAQPVDLYDIVLKDWPSVRSVIEKNLYDDSEPLPVDVDDLAELVRARPSGPVSTRLDWSKLTEEDFERLIYNLVSSTRGYENANWLMKTYAADRGRDIEVYRITEDLLSGTKRYRCIIQCKHWDKSVGRRDLIECVESVKLWEPPRIDYVIIATSDRFSQDAVEWAEKRNIAREYPLVELWASSNLETMLSRRPDLIAGFGLR